MSRLDTGAMRPEFAAFRIDELMRQIELEFAPMAAAKGLTLTYVPCSLVVRSDRRLLRRLVQNLISNAIKYTPSGRVLVGCRRDGAVLRIDVYDTGVGIPQSKLRDVFVEFHRLDNGARIARGLGLGLSIVERVARVIGSEVVVRSAVGRGSQFSVTVARSNAAPVEMPPRADRRVDPGQLAGIAALCIDNEPSVLDGMETLLRGWGCEVLKASNLTEALAAVAGARRRRTGCWSTIISTTAPASRRSPRCARNAATCRRSSSPPTARRPCASRRGRRASRCSTSR